MSEVPRSNHDAAEINTGYRGSLANAYSHFFGDTAILVSLFHRGHGVISRSDGSSVKKSEATEEEIRVYCNRMRQAFLDRMSSIDFGKTRPYGTVNEAFIREVITKAEGDWTDPVLVQQLMGQFRGVSQQWQ